METDVQLFISKAMFYQIRLSQNSSHKKLLTLFQFQAIELIKKLEDLENKNDGNSDKLDASTDKKEFEDDEVSYMLENQEEVSNIITREFFPSLESDAKPKYECPHCEGTEFEYLQSLQRHFRKYHKKLVKYHNCTQTFRNYRP